jgi:hypothetical protein
MKKILLIIVILVTSFLVVSAAWYFTRFKPASSRNAIKPKKDTASVKKWVIKAAAAKLFTQQNNYNGGVCFFVDMKIESGSNRFFVYNLKTDSIINSGLVTHGRCNKNWLSGRQYGNVVGCGCTSLGKYKIGAPYFGRFGLAYKLHGLDSSNSNAYKRYVVLHSHECVPAQEVSPYPICQSDGCPTVSPDFLKELQDIIEKSKQPVLLWIFE